MPFLLNSQAQGASGKMNNLIKHHGVGSPEGRGPMQLRRLHRLKVGPVRTTGDVITSVPHVAATALLQYSCDRRTSCTRDEHGSELVRTGSGLKPILAGSGLDRTAIF